MKADKAKIVACVGLLLGLIGTLFTSKSDELARDKMKAELKDEILNELNKRDS